MSSVPRVDALFAQKCVQRAWGDIRDSRLWSFLRGETRITAPDAITAGTASVTQGSATVVLDAAAQLALVGLTNNQIIERTFRAGFGHLYNIIGYAAPNLTLEYAYNDPTASGVIYSIYQPYFLAPEDFLSWVSVIDPYAPLAPFNVTMTKEYLDALDPNRGHLGQPWAVSTYRYETNLAGSSPAILDRYRYELWPHPVLFRQYIALFQRQGIDLVAGQRQPRIISDSLLMAKARFYAYEWAEANKGKHVELKGTNWLNLRQTAAKEYEGELAQACRQDEETFIQNSPLPYTSGDRIYLGDTYWQSHAPIWGGRYG